MEQKPIDEKQYAEALAIVAETQQASVSMIQRRLRIGYTKAAQIVQRMEDDGHIGPYTGTTPREVHVKPEQVKAKPKKQQQTASNKPTTRKKATGKGKGAASKKKPQKGTEKPKTPPKDTEAPEKPKGPGGRPKLWVELDMVHKLDAVRGWCMQGATMAELGEMLGVSETTLYEWRRDYPEFAETLRAGRNVANGQLLAAAFRASSGFHAPSKAAVKYKTVKVFKNPKTGEEELRAVEEVAVVDVTEYVPPNAQLLQFMLTNRLPDQYKKKEHIEHGGLGGAGSFGYMTDEELDAELAALEGGGDGAQAGE